MHFLSISVKTILFYAGFYTAVLLFFSLLLGIFLIRVDEIDPDVTHMDSPLQMNPGNVQLKFILIFNQISI